jgi:glycerophosphoryl diester phosphodiesterase
MLRQLGPLAIATFTPLIIVIPIAEATSDISPTLNRPSRSAQAPAGLGGPAVDRAVSLRAAPQDRPANVAHRGASASAPENTLAAFRAAAAQGADLFELDVQLTKDGKPVIIHDTTLSRTTNVEKVFPSKKPWRVRDLTLAQIRKLDAGSWFGSKYKGQRVPTLGGTLRAMNGSGLDMLMEVKSPSLYPGIDKKITAELRANPGWLGSDRIIVQSFDWSFVRDFHRSRPNIPTGLLGTPSKNGLAAVSKYADYVNPSYRDVTSGYVDNVHRRGMKIFAWTVNDPATMRRIINTGADGIITNKPATLRKVES